MLRECSKIEFDKYIDFVYDLATDLTKSGYPTYCDGIKTREMFIDRSSKAFTRDTEQILLFEYDGVVQGWIHYYWISEDNYLSTCSFNINIAIEQALKEFIEFASERFCEYDLYLGFPAENKDAIAYLSDHGFECIEEDYNNVAFLETCDMTQKVQRMVRINKDNYEYFRPLHDQIEGDMYWNSDRIYNDIDNWVIYVNFKDNEPAGAVYYTDEEDGWFEIFGIDLKNGIYDSEQLRELLNAAIHDIKKRGGKVLTFFCEEDGESVVRESGFKCVGKYLCYKMHLNSLFSACRNES